MPKTNELNTENILNYRYKGIFVALLIIASWAILIYFGLFRLEPSLEKLPLMILLILTLTFLYVGLFITAHDAMHGTLAPRNKFLNDSIGKFCTFIYALFDYDKLKVKHHQHHAKPVSIDKDPDYHDGKNSNFFQWFFYFMKNYLSIWQIVGMVGVSQILLNIFNISLTNILLFWALPAILSTLQLFYFGTYLPHREPATGYGNIHGASSSNFPLLLSFLTCYHFGYHYEHHVVPHAPWWKLPKVKVALSESGIYG